MPPARWLLGALTDQSLITRGQKKKTKKTGKEKLLVSLLLTKAIFVFNLLQRKKGGLLFSA